MLWRMAFLAILIMSGNVALSADHTNLVLLRITMHSTSSHDLRKTSGLFFISHVKYLAYT